MNRKTIISDLLLVLTALIWGVAFVAQSVGMDYIGPFTFNAIRNLMAGIVIGAVYIIMNRRGKTKYKDANKDTYHDTYKGKNSKEQLIKATNQPSRVLVAGICCGCMLFLGATFQQIGIQYTTTGNGGFLTALYIVLVPIVGLFIGKKSSLKIWLSVAIAIVGFYFLSISGKVNINKGDLLMLGGALCFACHILVVDHFIDEVDGVLMSVIQFFVAGAISCIPMGIFETVNVIDIKGAIIPLLYAGILSSGVGFTLQIVAQKNIDPVIASMLMSLESVFAALAGFILLHEIMTGREIIGCIIVFIAIFLAQIPMERLMKVIYCQKNK